jgi:hypothetical protein
MSPDGKALSLQVEIRGYHLIQNGYSDEQTAR